MEKEKKQEFDYSEYVLTLPEQIEEEFMELYQKYCSELPITTKKSNIIDSFWDEIGDKLLKASDDSIRMNNQRSKVLYHDVKTIEEIVKLYIKLCHRFNALPKIESISELLKINRDTFYRWNKANKTNNYVFNANEDMCIEDYEGNIIIYNNDNSITKLSMANMFINNKDENVRLLSKQRYDVIKKIRDSSQSFVRNALIDSNIGPAAIANNDSEVGLMWDAKRQITAEAIRQNAIPITASDLPKLE